MAETPENNGNGAPAQSAPVKMNIIGQYIRDLSYENIVAQKGTSPDAVPEISVQVSLDAKKRQADNQYEIGSKFKVTAKRKGGDETLFLMELDYAGVFVVENVPAEQLHPFLMIECPRMLFPFARRIIHDVVRDGGFPALNLENIDWLSLYRENLTRQAQAARPQQVS